MEQLRERGEGQGGATERGERDRVKQLRERGEGQGGATEREGGETGWSN